MWTIINSDEVYLMYHSEETHLLWTTVSEHSMMFDTEMEAQHLIDDWGIEAKAIKL